MAVHRYQFFAQDSQGNVVPGATITVRLESTNALASIFSDSSGTIAKANPFLADANGYAFFYADPGKFRVVVASSAGTTEYRDVELGLTFDAPRAAVGGRTYLTLKGTTGANNGGVFQMVGATAGGTNNGNVEWHDDGNTEAPTTRTAFIYSGTQGATPNNVGSFVGIATKKDGSANAGIDRVLINHKGWMTISSLGKIEPMSQLTIIGDVSEESEADVKVLKYGGSLGGVVHGLHAGGTPSAPTATPANSLVFGAGARAYDGTMFQDHSSAAYHMNSVGAQSTTNWGMMIKFLTTEQGTTTRYVRTNITHDGVLWQHDKSADWDPTNAAHYRSSSDSRLTVSASGASGALSNSICAHGIGIISAGFRGIVARGTIAAPTAVQANDFMCFMGGIGYDGSAYTGGNRCLIAYKAAENWTPTATGAYITFETTTNASTLRLERMRVLDDGKVAIGQTTVTSGFILETNGAIRCSSLTQTSDGDRKEIIGDSLGLDFIKRIKTYTFKWKDTEAREVISVDENTGEEIRTMIPGEKFSRPHQGTIYQQVEQVANDLKVDFGGLKDPARKGEQGAKGVDYSEYIAPLIKSVQELLAMNEKQQRQIEELKQAIAAK